MSGQVRGYSGAKCDSDRTARASVSAIVACVVDLMSEREVTAVELSVSARIGHGVLLRRLEDRYPFTLDEVERIAAALGMTLFKLMARAEDHKKEPVVAAPQAHIATDAEFDDAMRQAERCGWAMRGETSRDAS